MNTSVTENPDLAWDLDFIHQQRARDFVLQFEETLCVFSASVRQIYSNYNMYFPKDWDSRLVILPNPSAFHDTFSFIDREAVLATGLYIIPGDMIEKRGLYLANVDQNRTLGKRQVPFEMGIRAIMNKRPNDDPFVPILAKGDLREFEQSWPVLHLHRVKLGALEDISEHDRNSIANVVHEKLESLFHTQAVR
ncbi:MAG: hypothetical protein ACR2PZ_16640 [Pseudomonadales bacterium]